MNSFPKQLEKSVLCVFYKNDVTVVVIGYTDMGTKASKSVIKSITDMIICSLCLLGRTNIFSKT